MKTLRVLTYNIHKGRHYLKRHTVLADIKQAIESTDADIVFLQELQELENNPLEQLADTLWPHFSYGKNAVYEGGHHGNAILSKFPILAWENLDISSTPFAKRGLLHAQIRCPEHPEILHLICVHLDLFDFARRRQLKSVNQRIQSLVKENEPMILAGDFNDWRERAHGLLDKNFSLTEASYMHGGKHAKTFPSFFPMLSLDRIYFRGLELQNIEVPNGQHWRQLSDHLPLLANFSY